MTLAEKSGDDGPASRLLRFLEQRRETLSPLLILPHDHPDPDALASAFGLQELALRGFGVTSRIAYQGIIGRSENRSMVRILEIPANRLRENDLEKHRSVALVDTQPAFENNPFPATRRATLVIDQHPSTVEPLAELALIDPTCGATCVVLAQALQLAGIKIPRKLAGAMAYGIISDTLDLHRVRRRDVIDTYLHLLTRCDVRSLARIRAPARKRTFFVSLSRALRDAETRGTLIVSHLGPVDNPDMVSEAAEFLLTYERIRWVLCTGRYEGRLHLSLRTSGRNTAAGEVLRDLVEDRRDVGGHGAIAGGSVLVGHEAVQEQWEAVERDFRDRLAGRLRIPIKRGFRKIFGA